MSLSEACFNLHLSFLSPVDVQKDPEERSCSTAHRQFQFNTMQKKKTRQQCRHSSKFKAHSLHVTFSDIQHGAPAEHAVLKQSL